MLFIFGIVMILGNHLFGGLLQKSIINTVISFPILYSIVYIMVYYLGSYLVPMIFIVFIWGIVHAGGLIVGQTWLISEAKEAPEFGNSLFVSFSNLWNYFRNHYWRLVHFKLRYSPAYLERIYIHTTLISINYNKTKIFQF